MKEVLQVPRGKCHCSLILRTGPSSPYRRHKSQPPGYHDGTVPEISRDIRFHKKVLVLPEWFLQERQTGLHVGWSDYLGIFSKYIVQLSSCLF